MRPISRAIVIVTTSLGVAGSAASRPQDEPEVVVPRLWDEAALEGWATPLAGLGSPPALKSAEEYYAAPVDNLRTYPIYHPDFEPEGYRESLVAGGPQPLIEPASLSTLDEWIEAGRRAFVELDTAVTRSSDPLVIEHFTSAEKLDEYRRGPFGARTKDGVVLHYRWVVDRDGVLNVGLSSCSSCHSRLMPDGTLLRGAPSNTNLDFSPATRALLAGLRPETSASRAHTFYQHHGVPWLDDDPHAQFRDATNEEFAATFDGRHGAPPGATFARFNGSPLFVTRMADLRGIRDRRYLDSTGTFRNRGPADVARYGILVEFADVGSFGDHRMETEENVRTPVRPPDALMYAMALYLYSLDPAPSPHPVGEGAERGRALFSVEGCTKCHTPPLYTNNRLVAAPGFEPPDDAESVGLDVSPRRVGTDPGQALFTRKGTGYYRIPSLRGLWYRGLYEHSGSVASLEDWFDPARLEADYVPTGWRGPGVTERAVPGHRFGLELTAEQKRDLIAFLRIL